MTTHRCECPNDAPGGPFGEFWYEPEELKARLHRANECPGDYGMKMYERDGERIWLCSCCNLWGDRRISTADTDGVTS